MNPSRLLEHFDRISNAPDAVPHLRRFILDLAVRGKLVGQDPTDERASELVNRIQGEKVRLVGDGVGRKSKHLQALTDDEFPFALPLTWSWSQLAEVGFINPRNSAPVELPASFVPMTLISAEYGVASRHEVRPWGEIKSGFTHFAEGDVALAKITPCFENGKSTAFRGLTGGIGAGTTELHVVRPVLVSADYVLLFLKSSHFIESGIPRMTGTAGQKRVSTDYFAHSPFPLPPLAEQHRIVAKVDELMALCDRLEAAQSERERRRDRLVAASLGRLNHPENDASFREGARFHLARLPCLTNRPDQITALRKTILSFAVRGVLVQPDSNRESAAAPARDLASTSKFDVRAFTEARAALSVPRHWSVAPLAQVAATIVDCPHSTPKWADIGRICVRTNQFRPGRLDLSDVRFVSEETYLKRIERLEPAKDDLLYSREGGILGVACRVPANTRLCLGQRMMLIRTGNRVAPAFLELVLNSPLITELARGKTTGGAAPRVNVSTIKAYPIPVPPVAEQQRIVARVSELMALCDRLESTLTTTQVGSQRLLDALLHDAIAVSA